MQQPAVIAPARNRDGIFSLGWLLSVSDSLWLSLTQCSSAVAFEPLRKFPRRNSPRFCCNLHRNCTWPHSMSRRKSLFWQKSSTSEDKYRIVAESPACVPDWRIQAMLDVRYSMIEGFPVQGSCFHSLCVCSRRNAARAHRSPSFRSPWWPLCSSCPT